MMMQFKDLFEASNTLIDDALKNVNFNNKSSWGTNDKISLYPWSGENSWSGIYSTEKTGRVTYYNVSIDNLPFILALYITDNMEVMVRVYTEGKSSLDLKESKSYKIPVWNKYVSTFSKGLTINSIDKKAYTSIKEIQNSKYAVKDSTYVSGVYGKVTFENGTSAQLEVFAKGNVDGVISNALIDVIDNKFKAFKDAKDKFSEVFSKELSSMEIMRELKKLKPMSSDATSSSIPSSPYVSGTRTSRTTKFNLKKLITKYGEDDLMYAVNIVFGNNKTSFKLVRDILIVSSTSDQWYD
jgi:hypothetical protein